MTLPRTAIIPHALNRENNDSLLSPKGLDNIPQILGPLYTGERVNILYIIYIIRYKYTIRAEVKLAFGTN